MGDLIGIARTSDHPEVESGERKVTPPLSLARPSSVPREACDGNPIRSLPIEERLMIGELRLGRRDGGQRRARGSRHNAGARMGSGERPVVLASRRHRERCRSGAEKDRSRQNDAGAGHGRVSRLRGRSGPGESGTIARLMRRLVPDRGPRRKCRVATNSIAVRYGRSSVPPQLPDRCGAEVIQTRWLLDGGSWHSDHETEQHTRAGAPFPQFSCVERSHAVVGLFPGLQRFSPGRAPNPDLLPSEGRGHKFESCRARQISMT
jgi:hypothetical protein